MDFHETKARIAETINNLKDVKIDNQKRQAALEEQRNELMSDVAELEQELERLKKEKDSAESEITEAGKEQINELSEEIAITERKIINLGGLLERKAAELQELNRQSDQLYVAGYEKRCEALKERRDDYYQDMLDHIDALEKDYDNLCAVRLAHKQMTDETSKASVATGGEPIRTSSWGLTIRGNRGTIDRGWKDNFEAWIYRVAEILAHGDDLCV